MLSHYLNSEKLLRKYASDWLYNSGFPDVQMKRLDVENFVGWLQAMFPASLDYSLNTLFVNTPQEFADAFVGR